MTNFRRALACTPRQARPLALALPLAMPLTLLAVAAVIALLALLAVAMPVRSGTTLMPARDKRDAGPAVSARDTINGVRISDAEIIERIERIASQVPPGLLGAYRSGRQVRYRAHAFSAGDDTAISYGLFQEPAAALAFGCALDSDLPRNCEVTRVDLERPVYDDPPGVHCEPMGIALGAPAYEPDRCEVSG